MPAFEGRTPVRFATYVGHLCDDELGRIVGPRDDGREYMTIVDVAFDTKANTSRVGFAFTRTEDEERRIAAAREQAALAAAHPSFFRHA
jgi:hypothetical protein